MSREWEVVEHLEQGPQNAWLEVRGVFDFYMEEIVEPATKGELDRSFNIYPEELEKTTKIDKIEKYFLSGDQIIARDQDREYAILLQYGGSQEKGVYDTEELKIQLLRERQS